MAPAWGATVTGSIWSSNGTRWVSCDIPAGALSCDLLGDWVTDNRSAPTTYATSVDGVLLFSDIIGGVVSVRPRAALVGTDAFELLVGGIWQEALDDRLLALRWIEASDPDMGRVAESYSVMDYGAGLATSPLGIVLTPKALGGSAVATVETDLDGTGLATSPMGRVQLRTFSIDGSGLATSPMGRVPLRFVAIDGLGLATSPMGFRGLELVTVKAASWQDPAIAMDGALVDLASGASLTTDIQGSNVGDWFSGQGLVNEAGLPGASALLGSGYAGAAE